MTHFPGLPKWQTSLCCGRLSIFNERFFYFILDKFSLIVFHSFNCFIICSFSISKVSFFTHDIWFHSVTEWIIHPLKKITSPRLVKTLASCVPSNRILHGHAHYDPASEPTIANSLTIRKIRAWSACIIRASRCWTRHYGCLAVKFTLVPTFNRLCFVLWPEIGNQFLGFGGAEFSRDEELG